MFHRCQGSIIGSFQALFDINRVKEVGLGGRFPIDSTGRFARFLTMKNHSNFFSVLIISACISGCAERRADRVEITETMTRSEHRFPPRVGATSRERFQLSTGASSAHAQASAETQTASAKPFHFNTPPGWQEVAPTQFRLINLRLGPNSETECTVSITGGGVFSNVNRWRSQMGLEPLAANVFSMLPKLPVLDGEAVFVEFDGTYSGMGQAEPKENYRLMGYLLERGGSNDVYIKLVGPEAVLKGERENFTAFVKSLHDSAGHEHAAPASNSAAAALPPNHPPTTTPAPSSSQNASGMAWTVPDGWAQSPSASSMRLVTLVPDGSTSTECYVTVLRASDTLMNFNRWRGQMGQPPIDASAMAALETVEVLGEAVPLLAVKGTYTGMGTVENADYMMLGVARMLGSQSVFVKMIGPAAEVEAQQEAFKAFCKSLTVTE